MKKPKNDIEDFVSKSIGQIKSGMPKDCVLTDNFYFDISVLTTKNTDGKLNIILADIEKSSSINQIHRIKFAIADKKSRKENAQYFQKMMNNFISELSKLDNSKWSNFQIIFYRYFYTDLMLEKYFFYSWIKNFIIVNIIDINGNKNNRNDFIFFNRDW